MEHVTRLAPKTGFSFQMLISRQQHVDHASNDHYRSLALFDSTIVKSFHFNKFLSFSFFLVRSTFIYSTFLQFFLSFSLCLPLSYSRFLVSLPSLCSTASVGEPLTFGENISQTTFARLLDVWSTR